MSSALNPTNATQNKHRLYFQLSQSFNRMSKAMGQTADLMEHLQIDLHAMRNFAGGEAAKFMTVASNLNPEDDEPKHSNVTQQPSS
ncbi:hypothetical protein DL96DRAFT_1467344 [Flagelloscypha sp. PMI_526]|nr:hypothetical protein DL96DRAFT_1467344 [Flagelloscypha sp. PMI_526]